MNVFDAITMRRSVRSYQSRPIPDEVIRRMRRVLRIAPSACNIQPWRFILVFDKDQRTRLAEAAKGQMWMADAPVIVVGCGLPGIAYKKMGGHGNSTDIDVAIAIDHLTLAATAEGLGTCWIGAFFEDQAKAVLGVPNEVKIVAMTPLGYPASVDLQRPVDEGRRKADLEIFSIDRYDNPATT
ncbi:MAG: nitroreductase [Planctomycetes bacterium]|jgi:nitroreductase|nr:nitroreductase [Planctomycetota bacterium]